MTLPRSRPYLDTSTIDWATVGCATYEVHQTFCYEYPGPIEDVRQVLVVLPPDTNAGQRLIEHQLTVEPDARPRYDTDRFGNRVCHIALPRVDGRLRFDISMTVERRAHARIPVSVADGPETYLLPSPLAEPFPALVAGARELEQAASDLVALVEQMNRWVYGRITYRQGATHVSTTAQDAFELGQGVCQDYAHLMIALCRQCGIPARYVSGHLLGEGAMHAWVQVLVPDDATDTTRSWLAFDPTHGRRAGMSYLTIAIGRDYGDVSPTRGSFRAPYAGHLAGGFKQAGVLSVHDDC